MKDNVLSGYIRKICPHYDVLENIFGEKKNVVVPYLRDNLEQDDQDNNGQQELGNNSENGHEMELQDHVLLESNVENAVMDVDYLIEEVDDFSENEGLYDEKTGKDLNVNCIIEEVYDLSDNEDVTNNLSSEAPVANVPVTMSTNATAPNIASKVSQS